MIADTFASPCAGSRRRSTQNHFSPHVMKPSAERINVTDGSWPKPRKRVHSTHEHFGIVRSSVRQRHVPSSALTHTHANHIGLRLLKRSLRKTRRPQTRSDEGAARAANARELTREQGARFHSRFDPCWGYGRDPGLASCSKSLTFRSWG